MAGVREAALEIAEAALRAEIEILDAQPSGDEEIIQAGQLGGQVQFWLEGQQDIDGNVAQEDLAQFAVLIGGELFSVQIAKG